MHTMTSSGPRAANKFVSSLHKAGEDSILSQAYSGHRPGTEPHPHQKPLVHSKQAAALQPAAGQGVKPDEHPQSEVNSGANVHGEPQPHDQQQQILDARGVIGTNDL